MNKRFSFWLKRSVPWLLLLAGLLALHFRGQKKEVFSVGGGHSLTFEIREGEKDRSEKIRQIIPILKERLDPTGLAGLSFVNQGNRFEIRVPAASEKSHRGQIDDLIRQITKTGVLEFRIAPPRGGKPEEGWVAEATVANLAERLLQEGPVGIQKEGGHYAWFPLRGETEGYENQITRDYMGKRYILLSNKPGESLLRSTDQATAWSLSDARVGNTQLGRLTINFTFDEAGAKQFRDLTGSNLKEVMAILLDDEVYSAPTIQSAISQNGQITGAYTLDEARELARTLKAGSLPGKLNPEPISQVYFKPMTGEKDVKSGFLPVIFGLLSVPVLILIYYLLVRGITKIAPTLKIPRSKKEMH